MLGSSQRPRRQGDCGGLPGSPQPPSAATSGKSLLLPKFSISSSGMGQLARTPELLGGPCEHGRGHLVSHGLQLMLPLPKLLLQKLVVRVGLLQLGLLVIHLSLQRYAGSW